MFEMGMMKERKGEKVNVREKERGRERTREGEICKERLQQNAANFLTPVQSVCLLQKGIIQLPGCICTSDTPCSSCSNDSCRFQKALKHPVCISTILQTPPRSSPDTCAGSAHPVWLHKAQGSREEPALSLCAPQGQWGRVRAEILSLMHPPESTPWY